MKPKGTLLLIGGAEDRGDPAKPDMKSKNAHFVQFDILKEILPVKKGQKKKIEIITTASESPEPLEKEYKSAFKQLGYNNLGFINITDKMMARSEEVCGRIEKAHAVFFSGGDQFRISAILGGTPCVNAIKDKFYNDKDFVIAGTSAGAMVLSKTMIYEGGVNEAMLKEEIRTTTGLGIFDTCIIDTHFIKRGRFARLAHAVVMNPESLGIGLGEDTVFIIRNGNDAVCSGSGMVVIIDGQDIEQTNIIETDTETPIFVENLRVHLLVKGCRFSIKDRKIPNPAIARSHRKKAK